MKRIVVVLGVAAVMGTAVALGAGTVLAQADSETLNETITYVEETENPCTGEPITLETTLHFLVHVTTTESGSFFAVDHIDAVARGVSPSGTRYVTLYTTNGSVVWPQGMDQATGTSTFAGNIQVIRQGNDTPEEDFILRFTGHGTIDANGEWHAVVENSEPECR